MKTPLGILIFEQKFKFQNNCVKMLNEKFNELSKNEMFKQSLIY